MNDAEFQQSLHGHMQSIIFELGKISGTLEVYLPIIAQALVLEANKGVPADLPIKIGPAPAIKS